jgi:hypothetical protein
MRTDGQVHDRVDSVAQTRLLLFRTPVSMRINTNIAVSEPHISLINIPPGRTFPHLFTTLQMY